MKQFTIKLTPQEIQEFTELKRKLFPPGAAFVIPDNEDSFEWKRYNELMIRVQQEREAKKKSPADVFIHRYNTALACQIIQSTKKGYKVLQSELKPRRNPKYKITHYNSVDFANNGGIWSRVI